MAKFSPAVAWMFVGSPSCNSQQNSTWIIFNLKNYLNYGSISIWPKRELEMISSIAYGCYIASFGYADKYKLEIIKFDRWLMNDGNRARSTSREMIHQHIYMMHKWADLSSRKRSDIYDQSIDRNGILICCLCFHQSMIPSIKDISWYVW